MRPEPIPRLNRRLVGMLTARLPDAALARVFDPRCAPYTKWRIGEVLRAVVVAITAGCRSLAEAEALTARLSPAVRRALGILRRLPDTTARALLVALDPSELRKALHRTILAAIRRKALPRLPGYRFGVVAIDGKTTASRDWDSPFAQRQRPSSGEPLGLVRTQTCSLVSSPGAPCIDVVPIPAETNEDGNLPAVINQLVDTFAKVYDLFRMVILDAGAASKANAAYIRSRSLHYAMRLADNQPTLLHEALRVLDGPAAPRPSIHEDSRSSDRVVYELQVTDELRGFHDWDHLHSVLRVRRLVYAQDGSLKSSGERLWMTSLPPDAFAPAQWLDLTRRYWAVENNCHHTFDTVFAEDDRPWISASPAGLLNVLLLRRIAYNFLTLFRSRTLRSEEKRQIPWKTLLDDLRYALRSSTFAHLHGLRRRAPWQSLPA